MLRGTGFEVIDLGENVPAEKFVDAQQVGMSALLTVMPAI